MKPESAYYESLHETPLIANTIARKLLVASVSGCGAKEAV